MTAVSKPVEAKQGLAAFLGLDTDDKRTPLSKERSYLTVELYLTGTKLDIGDGST
jgi:hypothetical protein